MKNKDKKILGNILVLTVYALLGTFMVSCNKDDYATIYNPDNTKSIRPGMLTLNFTGSTLSDTSTTTTITMISTDGKTTYKIKPNQAVDVEEGQYTIIAQKLPAGSSLPSGTTISQSGIISIPASTNTGMLSLPDIDKAANSIPTSANDSMLSLPDFEMAIDTVNVVYNRASKENLTLRRMTRKLNIKSLLTGVDQSKVKNIIVTITGIASEKRIDGDIINGKSHSVTTILGIGSDGEFRTDFQILGIDTSTVQELTVTINYQDHSSYTFHSNISSILKDFNNESYESPTGIDIAIKSDVDGLNATILPWNEGWNEGGLGE